LLKASNKIKPTEIEEIPMRIAKMFVALTATALALAACANHKEPAEKAIAQVESALAEIRADAEKYAPEDLKGLDESIATLKRGFGNKRYSEVLTAQPSVASAVTALKETIAKAKADSEEILAAAQAEWTELNASVPPLVDAIQGRVDTLTKSRKLPKDVDKATFETIKTDFETVKTDWTSATQEFTAGAAADAVRKGRAARAKAEEIQAKLGMNS
jgi:ActR/RegA family two-component response regulator